MNTSEIFEGSFSDPWSGCQGLCDCGKEYYDTYNYYDWEKGEIDALENRGAIRIPHAIGSVSFLGKTYINVCECWFPKRDALISFLDSYDCQIADYINTKRKMLKIEYENHPHIL